MEITMQNKYCAIEYREDRKEIFMRDLTDMNNEPAIYTRSKRGIKNAWAAIVAAWNDEIRMGDISRDIFTAYNIKYHYWCMMD